MGELRRRINRAWNWIYAKSHLYFWAHCAICGAGYGGHEAGTYLYVSWYGPSAPESAGVCPDCVWIAKQRNKVFFETHKNPYVALFHERVPVLAHSSTTFAAATYTMAPEIEWIRKEDLEKRLKEGK